MDESSPLAVHETATYQALHNDLIFSQICELIRSVQGYFGWLDLAFRLLRSLAGTCRAFYLPALKALWRNMKTIFPLVQTMPADCWEIVHSRSNFSTIDNIHKLKFTRPITASDCERFRFYAPLIRTLQTDYQPGDFVVNPNVFQSLGAVHRNEFREVILLPSLDELHWYVDDDDLIFPHFLMFVNPNLRKLSIGLGGDLNLRTSFLHQIPVMCPNLQSLSLPGGDDPARMVAVSNLLCYLPRLKSFSFDAISTDTFIRLSRHSELTKFKVEWLSFIDWNVVANQLQGRPAFPSLKKVEVYSATAQAHCHGLLESTRSSLCSVTFRMSDCQTGSSYYRLLTAIQYHCSQSLHKIYLMSSPESPDATAIHPNMDPLLPTHLAPLFAFPDLTCLDIDPTSNIEVDDNWIQKIAESLPKIQTFMLLSSKNSDPDRSPRTLPKLTINCLVHFALNCPHLEHLGLAFYAQGAELSEQVSRRPSLHPTNLGILTVGYSPIWPVDVYTVAAIFSDWFPNIYLIQAGPVSSGGSDDGPMMREMQGIWTRVEKTIPRILKIRDQERRSVSRSLAMNQSGSSGGNAETQPENVPNGTSNDAMDVDG
ncbi:hypothetical protein BDN72DRAFT_961553 [Pluteus cervinus]|uniref:Uncharacterized protein n=1 Tax=Pluteus cervinus TaxID=181527 RepID=A0ACD3AMZ4_9AGAR|nr:hypothetical protein BDN72DRAFT_961553 [Pluteus cervinus]